MILCNKKVCIFIICLWTYYIKYVVSKPKLYYNNNMSNIIKQMPSLHRNIWWTFWGYNKYIQCILYITVGWFKDLYIYKKVYDIENIILNDKEELIIAWGKSIKPPKGVIIWLHTLCGNFYESSYLANEINKEINLVSVSYSRRGHSTLLKNPKFNTVGNLEDLIFIISKIKKKYPNLPIYAIGLSAGTSLLAQYLGTYNTTISAAILISPGYNFEDSQNHMPLLSSFLITNYIKYFFLYPNKNILKNKDKNTYNSLLNAKTIKEWHNFQWKYSSKESLDEYYKKHNPVHLIDNISCPILFINALDDIIFPKELIEKYTNIISICKKSIIVHTNYGSHLGFYEGLIPEQWTLQVIKEFLSQF